MRLILGPRYSRPRQPTSERTSGETDGMRLDIIQYMKKNIIHVIYPDEAVTSFVLESDDIVVNILEMVFAQFNHGSGMESDLFIGSKKRSLSVNDVVGINGKYYLCESFGWKEVTVAFVNQLEKKVAEHPFRLIHGPWFALNRVMEENKLVEA